MRINDQCLPCLVNQAIKTAKLCGLKERDELYREVFRNLSTVDFSKTNPEIIGKNYQIIKRYVGLEDPYKELKSQYNQMFLEKLPEYDKKLHLWKMQSNMQLLQISSILIQFTRILIVRFSIIFPMWINLN